MSLILCIIENKPVLPPKPTTKGKEKSPQGKCLIVKFNLK